MALSTGGIVGVVIGVILLLGLSIAAVIYAVRRRNITRRRKVLQDSSNTFLARANDLDLEKSREPFLYTPVHLEAPGLDYLPSHHASESHSENSGNDLVPLRRLPTSEVQQHRDSHFRASGASQSLQPPALSPPGSGSSSSSSPLPTPSSANFILPPPPSSSSHKKTLTPPKLPPLVIPGQPNLTTPAAILSTHIPIPQHPTVPPNSNSNSNPIPPPPTSQPTGVSLKDPGSGPTQAQAGAALTRSLSTISYDTESLYSQASAFTNGNNTPHGSAPWEQGDAPSVPEIPRRFMDEYLESKQNTPNFGAAAQFSSASGGHGHSHSNSFQSSINIDIDPYSSRNKGLKLPAPPETPIDSDEDPLARANSIGRLLKDRARKPELSRTDSEDALGVEGEGAGAGSRLSRHVSKIERTDSIKSAKSVSVTTALGSGSAPVDDHRDSYAKRIKRVRESQMDMLEEALTPTSSSSSPLPSEFSLISPLPLPTPLLTPTPTPGRKETFLDPRLEAYYLNGPTALSNTNSNRTDVTTNATSKSTTPRPLPVPTPSPPSSSSNTHSSSIPSSGSTTQATTGATQHQPQPRSQPLANSDLNLNLPTLPNPFENLPSPTLASSPSTTSIRTSRTDGTHATSGTMGTMGSVAPLGSSAFGTFDPFSTEAIRTYRELPLPGRSDDNDSRTGIGSKTARARDTAHHGYAYERALPIPSDQRSVVAEVVNYN
ncbi:hypothetical protein D9758_003534 [Tetrapyrgos nigripes]|uniref:Uncharacterized protein n=1 Tax=Tetrapyrgos nigripes TaxID=182062 RepID=A0A8H5GUZ6_9AGAR|nr:hypothetical protein D9758_003534 [Tetrapyrgos nigripes]